MSKFDFSEASNGLLKLTVDGNTYEVNKAGEFLQKGIKVPSDPDLYPKLNKAFGDAALHFAESKPTLTGRALTDQINLVRGTSKTLYQNLSRAGLAGELGQDAVKTFAGARSLEFALNRIPQGQVASPATLQEIQAIMVDVPHAANIINAKAHGRLFLETTDVAGKATRVVSAEALAEVPKLQAGIQKLVALHEAGGYTQADIKTVFLNSPKELHTVLPQELSDRFISDLPQIHGKAAVVPHDLATIGQTTVREAEGHANQASRLAQELLDLKSTRTLFKGRQERLIAEKGSELAKFMADNAESANFINTKLTKTFSAEQLTTIKSAPSVSAAMTSIAKSAESSTISTAENTAKKGGGLKGFFVHTEESVAKALEKNPEAKAEIGKMRGKNVAIAAVAAVGLTALGAKMFGGKSANDNQPNFAEREDARRAAAPAGHAMGA